jgi:hypothetical protein
LKLTFFAATLMLFSATAFAGSLTYTTGSGAIVSGTIDIGNHCDDCTTTINLPFAYTLYGTAYTTANVSSNGALEFGSSYVPPGPFALPDVHFDHTIFAYWGDLNTGDAANGQGVFTSISGAGPNRIFNIEWRARECCGTGAPTDFFELRLYEGTNHFDIIYGNLTNFGDYQTVGVQKDNTDFTQFSTTTRGAEYAGLMVSFGNPPATAAPEPGTVALFMLGGCAALLERRLRDESD